MNPLPQMDHSWVVLLGWVPQAQESHTTPPPLLSVLGRLYLRKLSSSLSRDKIRDTAEGPCFNKAENTGLFQPSSLLCKNYPPQHTLALGALSQRVSSPHKDGYHQVRKESRCSQPSFQSEGFTFNYPRAAVDGCLCNHPVPPS